MSDYIIIKSIKNNASYTINYIKSYRVDQSIEIASDGFEFIIGNNDYEVSDLISAGDKLYFYVNNLLVVEGYIDDVEIEYNSRSNDMRITGRDEIAILLDNDATPKTYNKIGLNAYLSKVMPKYGIKYYSDDDTKFDKIVVSPGENEYSVIDRLCKERNIIPLFDNIENKFRCKKLISTTKPSYIFSNTENNAIRIINANFSISNDIKSEVIVYGGNYEKNKNIKGSYKDNTLKTKKTRIMNESDIEKNSDAQKRAKEEFYNINKNALNVSITTNTKTALYLNRCAKINIPKMGFNGYMLIDRVTYTKNPNEGRITNISFKLMPGIKVNFKNNDIPLLPKL